jgi:hypothetical protein
MEVFIMTNNIDMATKMIKAEMIILATELMMGLIIPESVEWKVIVLLTLMVCVATCIASVVIDKIKER